LSARDGAGLGKIDRGDHGEPKGGGGMTKWSPESSSASKGAAALVGTRCGSATGREGENGGAPEHQELTRGTTKGLARRGEVGDGGIDGDQRRERRSRLG
jgi:hypothetical protein